MKVTPSQYFSPLLPGNYIQVISVVNVDSYLEQDWCKHLWCCIVTLNTFCLYPGHLKADHLYLKFYRRSLWLTLPQWKKQEKV